MKKTLIAAGVAVAMAAPVAMADTTVYGKVRQAVEFGDGNTVVNSYANRVGFKGDEDLGNGMSAFYKIEMATAGDTGGTTSGRFAFVGIKGAFGTVTVGDTVNLAKAHLAGNSLEDTIGDKSGVLATDGGFDNNQVIYNSPTINGFTVSASAYGDNSTSQNTLGKAFAVKYANGPLTVAVARNAYDAAASGDEDIVSVKYSMGDTTFSANYETIDATTDIDSYTATVEHKMGANTLILSYGDKDSDTNADDRQETTIGVMHSFSKRTNAMLLWNDVDADATSAQTNNVAIQLNHSF
jgi:predicted porin